MSFAPNAEHLVATSASRASAVSRFYPGIAFVSGRPELMSFGAQRRLHAADGRALRYRDAALSRGVPVGPDSLRS